MANEPTKVQSVAQILGRLAVLGCILAAIAYAFLDPRKAAKVPAPVPVPKVEQSKSDPPPAPRPSPWSWDVPVDWQ